MAINEAVFHSLLIAHCANKDTEAVASTLEILTNTGIGIGAEGENDRFLVRNFLKFNRDPRNSVAVICCSKTQSSIEKLTEN